VRTASDGKPQHGISFLLIDMNTPGITVRPIVTIDGIHHTNQVFFDAVRVPVANRVGAEGEGWQIAKFLLGHERTSIADTGPKLRTFRRLRQMRARATAEPLCAYEEFDARVAEAEIQLLALCALEHRYVERWIAGAPAGVDASILKVRGTEVLQLLAELALDLAGPLAAAHDPDDLYRAPGEINCPSRTASLLGHEYLYSRCWSIFGGTNEIQRNLIAKQALS
jgi:alkylation response protein AidB-like acyl-CoA dehydrogenase